MPGTCHSLPLQVGGQVKFYGMPGGTNTPSWTTLTQTVKRNRFQITVEDDVSGWPVNNYIVVTSTDYFPEQAEVFKILEGAWDQIRSHENKAAVLISLAACQSCCFPEAFFSTPYPLIQRL